MSPISKKIKAAVIAAMVLCFAACNSGSNVPDENSAEEISQTVFESVSGSENNTAEAGQGNSETEQVNLYSPNEIIFPAHEMGKTEFNAHIFEIPKFIASFNLPVGWTTGIPEEGENRFCDLLWSPVNIYDGNGALVGTIAFNKFEIYDDTTDENFYRMVYNQIMLGSVVSWDDEYTPVRTDPDGESATGRVRVHDYETNDDIYYPDVLAYDKNLLVYIGIQFDIGAVTDEQLCDIAGSVKFVPYDTASFIDDDENADIDSGREYADPAELCADYLEEYVMSVFTGSDFDIHKYSSESKLIEYVSLKHDYERNYREQRETMGDSLNELTIHTDSIYQDETPDGVLWLTVPYEVSYGHDSGYGRVAYFEASENEDGFYELTMAVEFGYGDNYLIGGAMYEKKQPPFDIDIDEGIETARKYL